MSKPIQDHAAMKGILSLAQAVGKNSAARLLELRGRRFCPRDQVVIEMEVRDYFVNSHLPELMALDADTRWIIFELAARAGMHAALEDQEHADTFNIPAGESIYNG